MIKSYKLQLLIMERKKEEEEATKAYHISKNKVGNGAKKKMRHLHTEK